MGLSPEILAGCITARLFGFLPYTWKLIDSKDERYMKFTKSLPWLVWSTFMVTVILALMILDLYWAVTEPRGRIMGYQSLLISQMVFDVITAITVIILDIYFWLKGDLLAYLLYNLTQNMQGKQIQVESRYFKIFRIVDIFTQISSLPLIFGINVYVQYETNLNDASVLASSIRILCLIASVNFIRLMHATTLDFVKNELRATFQSFKTVSDKNDQGYPEDGVLNKLRLEIPPEKSGEQITVRMITSFSNSRVSDMAYESHSQTAEVDLVQIQYAEVQDKVLSLFRHLRANSKYLDLPVALAMFCLIICLLVSLFYVTLWTKLEPLARFYSSCLLLAALLPTVAMLNSKHSFNEEVI